MDAALEAMAAMAEMACVRCEHETNANQVSVMRAA